MTLAVLQRMAIALLTGTVPSDAADNATDTTAQAVDLFGLQVCLGASTGVTACDLRLFPAPSPNDADSANPAYQGMELSAFGRRVCMGDVPDPARCDVAFGGTRAPASKGA